MRVFSERISNLFGLSGDDIVNRMEEFYEDNSESEKNSWNSSLPKLIAVLRKADLGNLYLVTEYELPAGGRIDATLLGNDGRGNCRALVIELKQWSRDGIDYYNLEGFPAIKVNARQPYLSRHPVAQTNEYIEALKRNHSNVLNGSLEVYGCQYLHDFECSSKGFFSQDLFADLDCSQMYFKGDEEKFINYLKTIFASFTDCEESKNLFINGEYIMTNFDMEIINKITESPEHIPMWHDQTKIMETVLELLKQQAKGKLRTNHMILVSGAAGTGKTIVGFRILAEYWNLHPNANNMLNCKYAMPQSRTIKQVLEGYCKKGEGIQPTFLNSISRSLDLLVIDEAHRVTDLTQTGRAIECAQIVVVLQDDRQRVRGNEIGTRQEYRNYAKNHKRLFRAFPLDYQKRSGLGSYVDRLDRLLYGDEQKRDVGLGIEVTVFDEIKNMEKWLDNKYLESKSAKYYAPYCWEWRSQNNPSAMDIVIPEGDSIFQKQWNPKYNQFEWYLDSKDKVGCVYTAQGLGFDYVAFIWWDDLVWRTDHWVFHIDKVTKYDYQLKNSIANDDMSQELLLNIYRVMLTRAKKGLAIWFKDEETKKHFKEICLREE